jgi:TonB-linked SusC/RagA family outer membrane protein
MKNLKQLIRQTIPAILMLMAFSTTLYAQNSITVKGTVTDANEEPLIGASVVVKGNTSQGTVTDFDGNFVLKVPSESTVLVISYVGMTTKEIKVGKQRLFKVSLADDTQLEEVVVVGYGQQKKASVVGSITQTDAKTLERHSGLPSLGAALTGNLPGVITTASTGLPGEEDPQITIRGAATLSGSASPLVLVDGVERPMNTVDLSSVQSISVLKDASATAVYGVKGANGVILITTKRGQEGKAQVHVKFNSTMKVVSKLPEKYDSYDTFIIKNDAIQRETRLNAGAGSWGAFKDMETIKKYRYPANSEEWDRYPNVDWQDEMFKKTAMSYNVTADVSGGTKTVKYFAAIDYTHEGDIVKEFSNNRGYSSSFGYNRINLRSNLDFDITKTTQFTVNLFGSNGVRRYPWGNSGGGDAFWGGIYRTAPDSFRPVNTNGSYGFYAPRDADQPNSIANITYAGDERATNTQITTDFILKQDLAFVTKGLKFQGRLSYDNTMKETQRGINDSNYHPYYEYINPESGDISYNSRWNQTEDTPYQEQVLWSTSAGSVDKNATYRKLYYSLQLDYARQFGDHEVTALGLFSRETWAAGSVFPHYREDWVMRLTYNYASRYFAEFNGAYNGSEKFGKNNRFKFFPALSAGWMISEEPFVKKYVGKYLDMLKVRASWGKVGDDNPGGRHLFSDQISYLSDTFRQGPTQDDRSPYQQYTITTLGNTDIMWETVEKKNLGFDYSFLGGLIAGSFDIFSDKRSDVILNGGNRAIPSYFGFDAPTSNLGIVKSHGWELVVRMNKVFANKLRLWGNFNITHAVNKIDFADDPQLKPAFQKSASYAIGQNHSWINSGFLNTWDDVIGEPSRSTTDENILPGDYRIVDFNADGVVDKNDAAPYKYTGTPENTYSFTLGAEWKGFAISCQFYGVNNVTRVVNFDEFYGATNGLFKEGSYYYASTHEGSIPLPRWTAKLDESTMRDRGTRYFYDGWFLRLKNAEISYTFTQSWLKKVGLNQMKIYLNGDNLLLWTDMPDDRESNFSGAGNRGAYPTVRRFNLGIDLNF